MIAYYDMVSCDKETFLRSKLPQEYFRQLKAKPLKGIVKPGPVYQFSKVGLALFNYQLSIARLPATQRVLIARRVGVLAF